MSSDEDIKTACEELEKDCEKEFKEYCEKVKKTYQKGFKNVVKKTKTIEEADKEPYKELKKANDGTISFLLIVLT